ncbi:MAG TPA: ATP-binding cassette domain-containing protein [bacterium]|nr:ATP-binding cassette domain-containing protein [bacterium]
MESPLLSLRDVKVYFPIKSGLIIQQISGYIRAVNGVSLDIAAGETLGLVGESGCGKSTTARAILQLNPPTAGSIKFEGKEITGLRGGALRSIYRDMQIIYQDPYASLNPRMTIREIVTEPLRCFGMMGARDRKKRAEELLEIVGLDPRYINRYPHEFSGGQRQRIGIARALSVNPKIIICDEPVSALDVSIQAQIINLLEDLQSEFGFTYLFIAHDLSVVKHISNRIAVMYLGRIVELAPSGVIYHEPIHPYTRALLSAVPIPDPKVEQQRQRIILTGDVPSPDVENPGCDFASRCPRAFDRCTAEVPRLKEIKPGHFAACHLY